jgi:hypothetical protein
VKAQAMEAAVAFLREVLAAGPLPARDVEQRATAAGHSLATFIRYWVAPRAHGSAGGRTTNVALNADGLPAETPNQERGHCKEQPKRSFLTEQRRYSS